jgi:hypothetical protein
LQRHWSIISQPGWKLGHRAQILVRSAGAANDGAVPTARLVTPISLAHRASGVDNAD